MVKMIILDDEQLKVILEDLPKYEPKSYQMQAVIRNHLFQRFNWHGIEFAADKFPNYSVIFMLPVKGDFVPWPRSLCYIVFSKNDAQLREIIHGEDFIEWTKSLVFYGVSQADVYPVLKERAENMGIVDEETNHANVFLLKPEKLIKRELPSGFRLGQLSSENAEQINNEWIYGTSDSLAFLQYLLKESFPTSAIFTEKDNRLVAYILYQPDGSMGQGYVNPDFRNRGLYQIVNYDLAMKVIAIGQPLPWVYVMKWNEVSQSAYRKLGAEKVDEEIYSVDWIIYNPNSNAE